MSDTLVSALISFAGGVFGGVIAYLISYSQRKDSFKLSNKQLSVQHITDKRVDWIYEVRNTMSEFVACAEQILVGFDDVAGERLG